MTRPLFVLVTNDAPRAALEVWCHAGNLPIWLRVIDDPALFDTLPDGAFVRCYWYGDRDVIAAWESVWMARREREGFEWISEEQWQKIIAWADEHRRRPSLALLYGGEADQAETAEPIKDGIVGRSGAALLIDEASAMQGAPDVATEHNQPRQSRWR